MLASNYYDWIINYTGVYKIPLEGFQLTFEGIPLSFNGTPLEYAG